LNGVLHFWPVSSPAPTLDTGQYSGVDLRVRVGSLTFKNPVIAASGTFGYGIEFAHLVNLNRLGGIVVKGLSIEPMAGAASPRMCETTGGIANAIGLQNIGVRRFVEEKLPQLRRYDVPVIANIFGRTARDYVEVIRVLEEAEGLAAYELNISCPNVEHGGAEFCSSPESTADVVGLVRGAAKRSLWVKLSPAVGRIGQLAKAAESAGADAVVVANTYPSLCLDVHKRVPRLGSTYGGLSGSAIKPITIRLVHEASQAIRIPILGVGGIETAEDIAEYLIAGANATEIGTASFADPRRLEALIAGTERWCEENKVSQINELTGAWRPQN
jgi:dihydroorotate dehydrogenase (NAD+) catalytic subunit